MYTHILIATDGSDLAGKAVNTGLQLAKVLNANATAVTVTELWMAHITGDGPIAFPLDDYKKSAAESAARTLAAVDDLAKQIAVDCKSIHLKDQYPADGILDAAKSHGCDLIVMASHGRRGLDRRLLGSQSPYPQYGAGAYLPVSTGSAVMMRSLAGQFTTHTFEPRLMLCPALPPMCACLPAKAPPDNAPS